LDSLSVEALLGPSFENTQTLKCIRTDTGKEVERGSFRREVQVGVASRVGDEN